MVAMQLTAKSGAAVSAKTDLLVLVLAEGDEPEFPRGFEKAGAAAARAGDLPREFLATCALYPDGNAPQKRLLLASAGKDPDAEKLRRVAAACQQAAEKLAARDYVIALAPKVTAAIEDQAAGLALGEGVVLGAYEYRPPSAEKAEPKKARRAAVMAMSGGSKGALSRSFTKNVRRGVLRAQSVCFARDLGNRAGNLLTPTKLAAEARKLAGPHLRVRAVSEAQMERLGMGALLSVSRGSREQARLIVLDYHPPRAKQTVCVVGKGLTFDAGGISLKPSAAMDEMRYDMCGGAAVLGLFHGIQSGAASPQCRVVGVVPASENLPGGQATKPGDIVRACNGTTIEVLNTDAEGRLILCDALAWAIQTHKPKACVDLATLTGAVIIALGHEVTGCMGNDQELIDEILAAGEASGDRCWQLPLWEVHKEQMKSKFADLKNINAKGDGNGSTAGGAFLSYFVGDTPWVHLDIAGSAWNAKAKDYYRGGASGVGVRLLLEWIERRR